MSGERLHPPHLTELQSQITDEDVAAWMDGVDNRLDSTLALTRPGSAETEYWQLYDAVSQKDYDENGNLTRTPMAILRQSDGSEEDVPVRTLISWQRQAAELSQPTSLMEQPSGVPEANEAGLPTRLERIFAPLEPAAPEEGEYNFDHLLDLSDDTVTQFSVEDAAVRKPVGRAEVDEWTQKGSEAILDILFKRDSAVRRIVEKAAEKDSNLPHDLEGVVNYIRTNAEIRMELGQLFLNRINSLASTDQRLGDRIIDDKQKNPDYPGYSDVLMSSREYAALLALSMIDGTFDNRQVALGIDTDEHGKVIRGQHRDAANRVLY